MTRVAHSDRMPRRTFLRHTAVSLLAMTARVPKRVTEVAAQEAKSIVIDCHVHLVRKAFPGRGLQAHYTWHEYDGDLFVAEMNRAGVDKGLLKSYSPKDLQYVTLQTLPGGASALDTSEEYMVQWAKKYPERLLWMDVFNPKDDDMNQWKEKIKDPLLKGLSFYPTNFYPSGYGLTHRYYIEILELAIEQGKKPVMITFEQTPPDQRTARLKDWVELVRRFGPKLHWDVMHGGYWRRGPGQLDRKALVEAVQELNAEYNNVWFGTAGERDEYPYIEWQEKVHALAEEIGNDKIVWASDWPYVDAFHKYFQLIEAVRRHADWLSQREKQWFLGENAARFMNLPEAKPWAG
ncbi:MAG: amidohydrolase [Acidobacteria bacterium]|nr:amidohydrolase [Acidobacteriota bacterium]